MHTTQALEVALDLRVVATEEIADDVVKLSLERRDRGSLPDWTPGSHVDLQLGTELVRQYSLCGEAGQSELWQVAVLREPESRGGSTFAHDSLTVGDDVAVRGPRNQFALVEGADEYIFIAGGIGITPLLSMIDRVDAWGKKWTLHYSGRRRSTMAFVDGLRKRYGDKVQVYSTAESERIDLERVLGDPQSASLVYCCGPERLIAAVESEMTSWPAQALHVERFSPRTLEPPLRDTAFEVELSRSRLVLTVPPEKSILQVVQAAGVQVLSSCTEGTCGTCETNIVSGVPEHRDSILTDAERADSPSMFICVSRACSSRLILEL
jgi:ferredoxin-NADP reductase